MGIVTITKKTKQGAPMYDTINLSDFPKYKKRGWKLDSGNVGGESVVLLTRDKPKKKRGGKLRKKRR